MTLTTENPMHIAAQRRRRAACSRMKRAREYTPGDIATLIGCTIPQARATLRQLVDMHLVARSETAYSAYRVL